MIVLSSDSCSSGGLTLLRFVCIVAVLLSVVACKSVPLPYADNTQVDLNGQPELRTTHEDGYSYCQRLAVSSDIASQKQLGWAAVLTAVAGAGAVWGGALGKGGGDSFISVHRGVLVSGTSALLLAPAALLFSRSADASSASAAAGAAMALGSDSKAKVQCLEARRLYVGARAEIAEQVKGNSTSLETTFDDIRARVALQLTALEAELESVRGDEQGDGGAKAEAARRERLKAQIDSLRTLQGLFPPLSLPARPKE